MTIQSASTPGVGLSPTVRFAQYSSYGPPEVLKVVESPLAPLDPDRILVEIRASGLSPFDVKQRAGAYSSGPLEKPRRTGMEGAGVVVATGAEVEEWTVGDRVLTHGVVGTVGSHLVVRARNLMPIPAKVSFGEAAAIGAPFGAAHQALSSLHVREGDCLIVHGGSGGVGQVAIQLARMRGVSNVIATSSSERFDRVAQLGAKPVQYGAGAVERIRQALAGARPTVVLDLAGTDEAFDSVRLLADHRRWATLVAGERADEAGLTAYSGGSRIPLTEEQLRLRKEGISLGMQMLSDKTVEVEIGRVFHLNDVAKAHRAYENRGTGGRILIVPEPTPS